MWRCKTCGSNLLDHIPECPVCKLPAESAAALNTDKIVAKRTRHGAGLMITAGVLFFLSWPVLYLFFPVLEGIPGGLVYFSGPLPVIPVLLFFVGFVLMLMRR
ncbi:MAG: hypothetical protein ACKVP0_03745 [Pirellulaceae bacterium]